MLQGETTFSLQVLPKGSIARDCWCTLGVNPGSAPVPTNGNNFLSTVTTHSTPSQFSNMYMVFKECRDYVGLIWCNLVYSIRAISIPNLKMDSTIPCS
jgi:hypothetical protein